MKKMPLALIALVFVLSIGSCQKQIKENDYPIQPVPFTSVQVTGDFWAPKIKRNHNVTIPIALKKSRETGRVKNFKIAGGLEEGSFSTQYPFDDSDVFKILEGASYSLQMFPDPELEAYLDTLIHYIDLAQEDDGYIYTNRTIMGDSAHEWAGDQRWEKTHDLSHELYNLGHMYEGAVAHYRATGKRNFLDIAIKSANLVDSVFGYNKLETYPGHQEIEIGLVKLYRVTGNKDYLDLAKFFLDVRGPDGQKYCQAHKKVTNQTKAVGHSVRAAYMYTGMADVAALTNDQEYVDAINRIWKDIVHKKLYVTGGIGASGGNEGFGDPYVLPNMSAYCETCASIANVFWNHRMFMHEGDVRYYDVLERTLYNALLSGVSLSGDRFFYPNPLASDGQHERQEWFGCACCPSNITRFLPSVPGYIYSKTDNQIMVNLYAENTADIDLNGKKIEVKQKTDYPWEGGVELIINPDEEQQFELRLRVPGWARNNAVPGKLYRFKNSNDQSVEVTVNGEKTETRTEDGYIALNRKWKSGDKVALNLPMPVRIIEANEKVKEDRGKVAVQRGPIIYAAEWPDNPEEEVLNLVFDNKSNLTDEFKPDMLNGIPVIKGKASQAKKTLEDEVVVSEIQELTLIPYHTWANRGSGEMRVWLPVEKEATIPSPAPTIAAKSQISASTEKESLRYLNDQLEPENSASPFNYNWWPTNNQTEWIQYTFEKPETVSKTKVYWFDDRPDGGCRIPESWEVLYKEDDNWEPVQNNTAYSIKKDEYNEVQFEPVTTPALRLKVQLPEEHSSGIVEWIVE
ncbi:MAG: glycoside hydrolase family 127 protein [Bacteroidota bacterium]